MRDALTDHNSGYISDDYHFKNIKARLDDTSRYYIFSNSENAGEKEVVMKREKLLLIKRFEKKQAWLEIWKKE
jgi:hypothetical protein